MRIESGAVAMQSDRSYYALEERTKATLSSSSKGAVILSVSASSKELLERSRENYFGSNILLNPGDKQEEKKTQEAEEKEKKDSTVRPSFVGTGLQSVSSGIRVSSMIELKLKMLEGLLRSLGIKCDKRLAQEDLSSIFGNKATEQGGTAADGKTLLGGAKQNSDGGTGAFSVAGSSAGADKAGTINRNQTVWKRTTVESVFMEETENTAFSAAGLVKTSDGREIGFNIDVEMSRAFMAECESVTNEEVILTDPLVINLDTDCADVTDQKFLFDIDADGDEEEISFAEKGSGFLALDKNGDGAINDGSELFGTKSGDGFKDLAEYDIDGNGWIDEGDDIFYKLKIWTKDENGNDKLLDLKEANVGALYLGSVGTEFSLNDEITNENNAVIRRTGVYLKETGEAGTMQHVDLAL